ncbi:uncharacterized protein ACA1_206870 [Acanthamoeba castellanii str. Neff]|uniref:Plexin repeat domain containing protein n=1 Tax=Acanthamoeba castellanii (strain ATCC 30010 / Neff) TaxID=1257118 RepID=L8GY32_ACACF|nr:uncharacterized protein ACA1_206870 [Acanthamoeba castellanii str. Neff]ELR17910.1 hypothetical protein ACA1_206870 [Acanthamoeba castellanii str. Neff]
MASSKQCTLLVLFVALLAVFAFADEAPGTSDAAPVTPSTTAEDSPVEASAYCSLYTSCSTCSGSCGWCGDSDTTGYCTDCVSGSSNCNKPASCTYKYWTHNICPSDVDALVLGVGAIIGIIVASVVGFCCLVAIVAGLIFCLCCRPRHSTYVIAGQPQVHHVHHEQPILHHQHHGYSQPGKHYNAV